MNKKIENILDTPPAPMPVTDEVYRSVVGWQSRISFLYKSDSFPLLATAVHAKSPREQFASEIEAFGRRVSKGAQTDTAAGIRNSFIARPDLRTEIQFPGSRPYVTHYRMVHNGPVLGAITSSLNRITSKMTMARQMTAIDSSGAEKPICYSGRPNTLTKFIELAEMVFQGELRCGKQIAQKDHVYQLKIAINSSLSTIPGTADLKLSKEEYELLKQMNGKTVSLRKPDGTLCHVKCDLIFFAKQFNFSTKLEETMNPRRSGKAESDLMSATVDEMAAFVGTDNPEVRKILNLLKNESLAPEESLFYRILLFKRAAIPLVLHCKSGVDRTSLAVAIAYALDQWESSGRVLPQTPHHVLREELFKEMFLSQITTAHKMTFYSRGKEKPDEGYGFKWQVEAPWCSFYFTQHPSMIALMPERLKKINFTSMLQMVLIPGGTIIGMRNIVNHFGKWITAKDQINNRRVLVAFSRALGLVPLMVKCLVEIIVFSVCGGFKTLYQLSPEKIVPVSTQLNNRPLHFS